MRQITVARIGSHRTVKFAVAELGRYLKKLDPEALIEQRVYDAYDETVQDVLWVGVAENSKKIWDEMKDIQTDDGILAEVTDYQGMILGSNERSVLIAVYRFLKELGIGWLHPGENGELVPRKTLEHCQIMVREKADMRYRVMCIEGAVSYEHIYNMIDWLPKVGMNGYFIQFEEPVFFLQRWYSHAGNEGLGSAPLEQKDVEAIHKKITEDIRDRSLIYQAVGHGWTCEPFGISSNTWGEAAEAGISEEVREMLALRNGKRELFGGAPANTQFCMSNPKAVEIVSGAVAEYCRKHPEVSDIHVWLADMRNNFCECENCRKYRPADLYVELLNRIDEKLTAYELDTKVLMLSYNDLSWAPLERKLKHPERFVLMFAPITRSFWDSFADADLNALPQEPGFILNQLVMPRTNPPVLSLMKGWENFAVGGRCIFDYHLWSTTLGCDLGGFRIARVLSRDIKTFESLKLEGLISCQPQRCSFPNNLPMQVMAQTLWDTAADAEAITTDYFAQCYAEGWETARAYLEMLSALVAYWPAYNEADVCVDEKRKEAAQKALGQIAVYRPAILNYASQKRENALQERQWRYLALHAELAELEVRHQVRKFSGESTEQRKDAAKAVCDKYRELEPTLHEVLDVWRQLKGYSE